jgi:anaerobic dimethyl sulfoxide reductase subunit A
MRDIQDGDSVLVFNQRGTLCLPCRITARILPGVIDIPQGAWWAPDKQGVDQGGNINVLTSQRWTPFAFGSTQHTIMVQVKKLTDSKQQKGKAR